MKRDLVRMLKRVWTEMVKAMNDIGIVEDITIVITTGLQSIVRTPISRHGIVTGTNVLGTQEAIVMMKQMNGRSEDISIPCTKKMLQRVRMSGLRKKQCPLDLVML